MTPQELFDTTLENAISAFQDSNIIKKQNSAGKEWGLSICGTPIQFGTGIILGINWGGGGDSKNERFANQGKMPSKESFLKDYTEGDYKFLKKSEKLILEFLKLPLQEVEFNYFNLCFFRSPVSGDLVYQDYKVCHHAFEMLVNKIEPPWILSLGNSNMNILKPHLVNLTTVSVDGTIHVGHYGKLWGNNFYCVPHPNARRLSNIHRTGIWKKIFANHNL